MRLKNKVAIVGWLRRGFGKGMAQRFTFSSARSAIRSTHVSKSPVPTFKGNNSMTISNGKRNCPNLAGVIGVIALTLFHISACATGRDEIADNARVTRNVRALLAQHAELGPPNLIYVETLDHVVYLTGFVSVDTMRRTASEVALESPGAARVVNTIAISN
jgi:BON domain